MNAEQKAKWIKALRSGEFSQCRGQLKVPAHSKDSEGNVTQIDRHCCLGVANAILELGVPPRNSMRWPLPEAFLPSHTQNELSAMNDDCVPFAEIADFIEREITPTE